MRKVAPHDAPRHAAFRACVAIIAVFAVVVGAHAVLRSDGMTADARTAFRERIVAMGLFVPTNDWEDRLDLEQPWRIKPSRSRASSHEPAPAVAARTPIGASIAGGTQRREDAKPVKRLASTAKSDKSEDDDDSPWTKEGSRGTVRTLCVRTCDGFYWPISFSTSKDNLGRDAKMCERSCGVPARLYYHENPGQEPDEMEDQRGKRYKDLKTAYLYRTQYNAACTCKPQPWDEAALVRHQTFAEAAARKGSARLTEAEIKKATKTSSQRRDVALRDGVARQDSMAAEAADAAARLASALPAALLVKSAMRHQTLLWQPQPAAVIVPANAHQSLLKHVARNALARVSTPGAAVVASSARGTSTVLGPVLAPARWLPASGPQEPTAAHSSAVAKPGPDMTLASTGTENASPARAASATARVR